MALSIADRVFERTVFAGGTGAVSLTVTAVSGYQTFLSGWGASGSGWYCLIIGAQWESGLGTLNAGGTTLTRTTVNNGSSGPGVPVSFSAGTMDVTGVISAAGYGTFNRQPIVTTPLQSAIQFTAASGTGGYIVGRSLASSNLDDFFIYSITAGAVLSIAATTGAVAIAATTASSSTSTGALKVAGGAGFLGDVFAGGQLNAVGSATGNYGFTANNSNTGTSASAGFSLTNNAANTSYVLMGSSTYVASFGGPNSLTFFAGGSGPISFMTSGILRGFFAADGGLVWGTPTGGTKGVATINASAVYDDNVLLTCFAVQHLKYGRVDLTQWDALSPTGNHALAHRFVGMLAEFDPRDPKQYIDRMLDDEALPGMPNMAEWQHNTLSLGEVHNRLWLATELLGSAWVGSHNDHERRISALEAKG